MDNPALIKTYSFNISTTVSMKGGFSNSSTGTDLSQYEPKIAHITRLSGDNVLIGNTSDNSYKVIYLFPGGNLTLDGFYISEGYGTGAGVNGNGGGMYLEQNTSTAVVSNCIFENNTASYGAGIYVYNNSTLTLNNVIIRNNSLAGGDGAGIFAWGNVNLYNSTICNNTTSTTASCDGLVTWNGNTTIKNSTFSNNGRCGMFVATNNIRTILIENSTFTNHNGSNSMSAGIYINPSVLTGITINNTLIVNNKTNITNNSFAGSDYKYSIIGTTLYGLNKTTTSTVAPVSLDILKDNGAWGPMHALLNPCNNPAVGSGNPAVLSDAISKYDQRGVLRKNPPSIGAYDASDAGQLHGIYIVKTGGDFNTLKEAADRYNSCGISANTTFLISGDLLESDTVKFKGTAPGSTIYTLTVTTDGSRRTVSGNINGPLVQLVAANNITFDGIIPANVNNATANQLVIKNTNPDITKIPKGIVIQKDVSNNPGINIFVKNIEVCLNENLNFYISGSRTEPNLTNAIDVLTENVYIAGSYIHHADNGISITDVANINLRDNISKNTILHGIRARNTSVALSGTNCNYAITGNYISDITGMFNVSEVSGIYVDGADNVGNLNISGNTLINITRKPGAPKNNLQFVSGIVAYFNGQLKIVKNTVDGLDGSTAYFTNGLVINPSTSANTMIDSCVVKNVTASGQTIGIYLQNKTNIEDVAVIQHCIVDNVVVNDDQSIHDNRAPYGIAATSAAKINANNISNIINGSTNGTSNGIFAFGINLYSSIGGTTSFTISNNMISKVINLGNYPSAAAGVYGIYTANENVVSKIYQNSILLSGNAANTYVIAVGFNPLMSGSEIKNNILVANESSEVLGSFTIGVENSSLLTGFSKNNILYVNPTLNSSEIAYAGTTSYTTVSDWNNASGDNARAILPAFVGSADLHLTAVSMNTPGFRAPVLQNVAFDFDNQTRNVCSNRAGADTDPNLDLRGTTIWSPVNGSSDWDDANNWDLGVPVQTCTDVIIPGGLNSYPDLSTAINPSCDTITFKFGGEVAKTYLLNYNRAKVELTLNDPNRWWMVAAPLRNMYSGDYFVPDYEGVGVGNRTAANGVFRYNPGIYIMQYQVDNPQNVGIQAAMASTWSKPFNTVDVPLKTGDGYVIWPDKTPAAGDSPETTFRFPKDSTIYSYYRDNGQWVTFSSTMDRAYNGRFAYENQNQLNGGFYVTPTNLNTSGYETIIVGNPFMSHLDMNAFLTENSGVLQPSYYIWSGGDFEPQLITSGVNQYVAPMQSFIVTKKFPANTSNQSLKFTYDMSATKPGSFILKGSKVTSAVIGNRLNISLWKDSLKQSGITMMYRDVNNAYNPTKDVYTLFNNDSYNKTPIVYGLLDGKAVSIHTGNDSPFELDIRSKTKESLMLHFAGIETFNPEASLYFEDRLLNKSINLREQQSYTFNVDSATVVGRFFLRINNIYTGIDETNPVAGNIRIISSGRLITVTSDASDPIRKVEIFDARGVRLFNQVYDQPEVTIVNKYSGIVIVKVVTLEKDKTQKLLVDNK